MLRFLGSLLLLISFVIPTFASDIAGTIKSSKGEASIVRDADRLPASVGASVLVSDAIETGEDGTVGITLKDNTRLTAGPNSELDINKFTFNTSTYKGSIDASLKRGTLGVISGKVAKASPGQVRFSTPTVTLGVRGTRFIMEAGQGED